MPRVALLALSQLTSAPLQRIVLPGRAALLIVHRNGQTFVLDDTCSHGAASLSEGELINDEILCPHHRGGFDIRSGAATRAPCGVAIGSYRVSIEGGMIYVDLE